MFFCCLFLLFILLTRGTTTEALKAGQLTLLRPAFGDHGNSLPVPASATVFYDFNLEEPPEPPSLENQHKVAFSRKKRLIRFEPETSWLPVRRATTMPAGLFKKMIKIFFLFNLECCKSARMRFHCANDLFETKQSRTLKGSLVASR